MQRRTLYIPPHTYPNLNQMALDNIIISIYLLHGKPRLECKKLEKVKLPYMPMTKSKFSLTTLLGLSSIIKMILTIRIYVLTSFSIISNKKKWWLWRSEEAWSFLSATLLLDP
ncbi:hypothetical protein PS15m_003850 [Mucor circinelloides]